MMEKDKSIINFIERLKSILNFDKIQVIDYWEADLCAIGLQDGPKLVYISTYRFSKEKVIKYDIDLEYNNKTIPLRDCDEGDAINRIAEFFMRNELGIGTM